MYVGGGGREGGAGEVESCAERQGLLMGPVCFDLCFDRDER